MIATPLVLLLVMLTVQFGLWWHTVHVAQVAADEALGAARTAVLTSSSRGGGAGEAAARAQADAVLDAVGRGLLLGPRVEVSTTGPTGGSGAGGTGGMGGTGTIRVEVTGTAQTVVPGVRLAVRAVAAGSPEQWTTPTGSGP